MSCLAEETIVIDIDNEQGTTDLLLAVTGRVIYQLDRVVRFRFSYVEDEDCYRVSFHLDDEGLASFSPMVDFQQEDYENRQVIEWIKNYLINYLAATVR